QAGPVVKVKIPRDRDGRPKQFAFVNFKHEESVPYGLSLLNGIKLYGRPIKIQFRSGSSHVSQDGNLSGPPHGAANASPSGAPHPASNCSRYDAANPPTLFPFSLQTSSAAWQPPPFGGKYEPPAFALPGYAPAPHAFHPSPGPQTARPRKGRLGAHPYHPDSRHFAREQRFGERGPDYCRGKWEEYGFDERGHDAGAEHHYRAGREEPAYEDRHRDGWSHDYDYRRESYREAKWHPSRH
ncbi:RBM7 protein, partial [Cochlearius cochlearius]|nr:RBM7 protein [Cochlearius cochlearius]